MAMGVGKVFVVVVVLTTLVTKSLQLDCYDCVETSVKNAPSPQSSNYCNNGFPNNAFRTCGYGNDICMKIVRVDNANIKLVERRCGNTFACDGINNIPTQTCYSCTGDKCNGASAMTIATVLLLLPAVFFVKNSITKI